MQRFFKSGSIYCMFDRLRMVLVALGQQKEKTMSWHSARVYVSDVAERISRDALLARSSAAVQCRPHARYLRVV